MVSGRGSVRKGAGGGPLATSYPTAGGVMRWIWVDRFLEFESGKSATAVKNTSLAEEYFADHFPGYPVVPAALKA